MSEDPKPLPKGATPVPPPPPPPPAEAKASPSVVPQGGTKEGAAPTSPPPSSPSRPPIEYAMPAHKSSWLPSPALIKNLGCLFKLMFGLTVVLCMGYFALVALNPKARQWALQGTKPGPNGAPPSGKGPTPFKVINQVLAIPAQALGKTDDVVKANNARAGLVDNLVAEEEAKAKGGSGPAGRTFAPVTDPFATPAASDKKPGPAGAAPEESAESQAVSRAALLALAEKNATPEPPPAEAKASPSVALAKEGPSKPDSPEQIKLAGNIIIAHSSPAGAPRASAAFFFWVVNLNVSGITQGKPARLLLNNRLAYEGDVVNRSLGITFAQLNAPNQLLVFRDQSGATVTRSY